MEKGRLGGSFFYPLSNEHLFNVIREVENKLNVFLVFTCCIVVVNVQAKLVAVTNYLAPSLSKCLLHMPSWSSVNVSPKAQLASILPLSDGMLRSIFSPSFVSAVLFTKSIRHLVCKPRLNIGRTWAPKTVVYCPLPNITKISGIC